MIPFAEFKKDFEKPKAHAVKTHPISFVKIRHTPASPKAKKTSKLAKSCESNEEKLSSGSTDKKPSFVLTEPSPKVNQTNRKTRNDI